MAIVVDEDKLRLMEDFMEIRIVYRDGEYAYEIDNGSGDVEIDVVDVSTVLGNLMYYDSNFRTILYESTKFASELISQDLN